MSDQHAIEAIRSLIHEYCFRLDAGALDSVAALFSDATISSNLRPGSRRGQTEVREMYDPVILYEDGTPRTMHRIANTTITVEDGTASSRSYFEVLQQVGDRPIDVIIAGEYRDEFRFDERLGAGEWRFEHREIAPLLMGDLSRHLRRRG